MRLSAIESKLEGVLDQQISALRGEFVGRREEMIERIENTETRLLRNFRKWAVRIESVAANETRSIGLDQQVAVIMERLKDLEERP